MMRKLSKNDWRVRLNKNLRALVNEVRELRLVLEDSKDLRDEMSRQDRDRAELSGLLKATKETVERLVTQKSDTATQTPSRP